MIWWLMIITGAGLVTLPFFGDQATRLLRESWDGILKADPSTGDIKPHGATELADELFAMLDDNIPQTQNAPVTFNQTLPNATPAITTNAPVGDNSIVLNGGGIQIGNGATFTVCGGNDQQEAISLNLQGGDSGVGLSAQEFSTQAKCSQPIFQSGPNGTTVTGDLNLNGGFYLWNGVPIGLPQASTTVFLAKVVSGSGGTYKVDIYGKGSSQPATNPVLGKAVNLKSKTSGPSVTATIPQFNPSDSLPAGTWIGALHQFTNTVDGQTVVTFEWQPAVWLS